MAGKNKNKKRPQTGGLQPKGGAYAGQEAAAAQGDYIDPMAANAALKEKAKDKKAKQQLKDKEKDKKEKKPGKGKLGFWLGAGLGAVIGAVAGFLISGGFEDLAPILTGAGIGLAGGAILLGIIFANLTKFKETGAELKKVRWPTMATTFKQTGVVLVVVLIFGVVVFGLDMGLSALYNLLTKGF